jgi:hypothetical protein
LARITSAADTMRRGAFSSPADTPEGNSMSHVLTYRGQYFRVEIAEVVNADQPAKSSFAAWASEPFRELAKAPAQACSRFIGGPPVASREEAMQQAYAWIKANAAAVEAKAPLSQPSRRVSVLYTVWVYKDDEPTGFDFENFWEAESFAENAKKSAGVKKVGIKNNESPQYLTLWER